MVPRPTRCPTLVSAHLDSRVPPRGIFKRHLQDKIGDGLHDAGPAWAAPVAVIPFGRHEFAVPSQQRVRRNQSVKLGQHLASKCLGFSGESAPLGISEAKASPTQTLLEHAVLFLEILDHVQLVTVDPTGDH